MSSPDGRYQVVFNGEIYNYIELREELKELGHVFRSNSDTEVLLASFSQWHERAFNRFIGMFAFALWDARRRRLLLARDRVGKKPLYFADDGRRLAFASELKSLRNAGMVGPEIDPGVPWCEALGEPALALALKSGTVEEAIPAGTKLTAALLRETKLSQLDLKTFRVENKKVNEKARQIIDSSNEEKSKIEERAEERAVAVNLDHVVGAQRYGLRLALPAQRLGEARLERSTDPLVGKPLPDRGAGKKRLRQFRDSLAQIVYGHHFEHQPDGKRLIGGDDPP